MTRLIAIVLAVFMLLAMASSLSAPFTYTEEKI